jgi:hypothetical protein
VCEWTLRKCEGHEVTIFRVGFVSDVFHSCLLIFLFKKVNSTPTKGGNFWRGGGRGEVKPFFPIWKIILWGHINNIILN